MSSTYFAQATIFLVELSFDIFILALILRYLFTVVRIDSFNPLSGLIIKITDPLLKPLRRTIPSYLGVDWPLVLVLFVLQAIEITLVTLVATGGIPALAGLAILTIANLLRMVLYIYLFIILIQVIISWINPNAYSLITKIMQQISTPILNPVRKLLPSAGGIDFSPLIILVIINLLMILVVSPLLDWGQKLSL
tara:strand:- start:1911 stop:2492 length:582 start_codon:yes stop_codon:yes gene_type:complete